jgi:hypothetical protein
MDSLPSLLISEMNGATKSSMETAVAAAVLRTTASLTCVEIHQPVSAMPGSKMAIAANINCLGKERFFHRNRRVSRMMQDARRKRLIKAIPAPCFRTRSGNQQLPTDQVIACCPYLSQYHPNGHPVRNRSSISCSGDNGWKCWA